MNTSLRSTRTKVVVASTVMLTFISFWRAAAIVLNDLGSSVYYVGGIAEQAIGRSAPWFILGVMPFSFAVRSIYMESSSEFGSSLHHRDVVGVALRRMVRELNSGVRDDVVRDAADEIRRRPLPK